MCMGRSTDRTYSNLVLPPSACNVPPPPVAPEHTRARVSHASLRTQPEPRETFGECAMHERRSAFRLTRRSPPEKATRSSGLARLQPSTLCVRSQRRLHCLMPALSASLSRPAARPGSFGGSRRPRTGGGRWRRLCTTAPAVLACERAVRRESAPLELANWPRRSNWKLTPTAPPAGSPPPHPLLPATPAWSGPRCPTSSRASAPSPRPPPCSPPPPACARPPPSRPGS